ncbi:MAG: hypothetical protein RLZZ31_1591 [Actinomycetota bacterium]
MEKRLAGDYGVDSFFIPVVSVLGAGAFSVYGFVVRPALSLMLTLAALSLLQAYVFLRTSRQGKFVTWQKIVDELELKGNENVLDAGCGLGMVLFTMAVQLPKGEAVGVDDWKERDPTGQALQVAEENAKLLKVNKRVKFKEAPLSELPFANDTFDVVTSNSVIQAQPDKSLRADIVRELYRVTKPGGRLRFTGIHNTNEYTAVLKEEGAVELIHRRLGFNSWFGNPAYSWRLVAATKPMHVDDGDSGSTVTTEDGDSEERTR